MCDAYPGEVERSISLRTGIELAFDDVGKGRPIILIHGFPETRFSWRHQVPALVQAGHRVVAIDCRGYGASAKPEAVEAYALELVVEDIMALAEAESLERPVLVGHDWGSILAWTAAVLHPEAFAAVASLNVPYRGWCVGFPTISFIEEHLSDRFGYVVYFQREGQAEASFAKDPADWLRRTYTSLALRDDFLEAAELEVFVKAFTAGGIAGPLNYYRNIDRNHEALARFENAPIEIPALMVVADADPVLPASLVEGMDRWIPDLTVAPISSSGHWVQQEQPAQVNAALVTFLERFTR